MRFAFDYEQWVHTELDRRIIKKMGLKEIRWEGMD